MIPHASVFEGRLAHYWSPLWLFAIKNNSNNRQNEKKGVAFGCLEFQCGQHTRTLFLERHGNCPAGSELSQNLNTCSVHWYIGYSRRWSWHWWSQIQGPLGWPTRWHASGRLRTWVNMADAVSIKITRIELQPWSKVLGRYQPPSPPESMLEYQLHTVRNGHQLTPTLIRGEGEGGGGGGGTTHNVNDSLEVKQ